MAQASTAKRSSASREESVVKQVFLSPTVILILALSIFPLLWSLGISFTDIQRGGSTSAREADIEGGEVDGFLGFDWQVTTRNYERIPDDRRLHTAALNTLFYVGVGVLVQYTIGFLLAVVLNEPFLGRNIVRVIFLMPMMMTPVAVAYTGRMMLDASRSPLAHMLREISGTLALDKAIQIPWFTSADWAPWAIVIIDSWQWIPFMTLILLAGMQSIPDDVYEAARVDGANAFTILARITFPILTPVTITVVLIRALEIFKIIDVIVVTTGGGPGSATESLTMYIFDTALTFGNFGYAAAVSFMLLILVVVVSTLFIAVGRFLSPLPADSSS